MAFAEHCKAKGLGEARITKYIQMLEKLAGKVKEEQVSAPDFYIC